VLAESASGEAYSVDGIFLLNPHITKKKGAKRIRGLLVPSVIRPLIGFMRALPS
jgi:hypothetical protein